MSTFTLAFLATLAVSTSGAPSRVSIDVGTDVPLAVGARIAIAPHSRARASTSIGFMPGPYVDLINASAVAAGAYDEDTARVVKKSLESSLVWRTHAGVRIWRGLYFDAGYGLVALGGSVAGQDLFTLATGTPAPPGAAGRSYDVSSTLHLVDLELGYEWRISRFVGVRTALGYAGCIDSRSRVKANFDPIAPLLVAQFEDEMEAYLDETFESYVHLPVATVDIAWRFD